MFKYLRVLKQIDKRMNSHGFTLYSVGDGEENIKSDKHTKTELYEWATQCDLGSMSYRDLEGNRVTFYLVYGNALHETISDYGWNTEKAKIVADDVSDKVSEFYEQYA